MQKLLPLLQNLTILSPQPLRLQRLDPVFNLIALSPTNPDNLPRERQHSTFMPLIVFRSIRCCANEDRICDVLGLVGRQAEIDPSLLDAGDHSRFYHH